jgi:SNF2 family DNA or RNA helicase
MLRLSADRYEKVQLGQAGVSGGSVYAHELAQGGALASITRAPKIDATVELIEEILDASPENKVVLFSFFTPSLNVLQERIKRFTESVQFKGSMNAIQRDKAKEEFQSNPHCRVFLSSDAGGYGVDLPNANFLINLDLPWSSGRLVQRNSRIIRTSSTFKNVTLINMLMQGSIEERQYDMLTAKKQIAEAILDGKGIDMEGKLTLNLATLTTFLQTSEV